MDEVGQNMSSFIRGSSADGVYLQYVAFYVNLILFYHPIGYVYVRSMHIRWLILHPFIHGFIYLLKIDFFTVFLIYLLYVWTLLQYPEL